jgi:hypothetical protein
MAELTQLPAMKQALCVATTAPEHASGTRGEPVTSSPQAHRPTPAQR